MAETWKAWYRRYGLAQRALLRFAAVSTVITAIVAIANIAWHRVSLLELFLIATILSVTPVALAELQPMNAEAQTPVLSEVAMRLYPIAAVLGAFSIVVVPTGPLGAYLAVPWFVSVGLASLDGLARFVKRGLSRPEELAIDFGLLYLPMAGFWFIAYRLGSRPLGVPALIVLLAAVHFAHAGFTALFLTGLAGRWLMNRDDRRATYPLWFTAASGLICPTAVAFGIAYSWRWLEVGGALGMEAGYLILAVVILWRVVPHVDVRPARLLLTVSAVALAAGIALAIGYTTKVLDIPQMARSHGWVMLVAVCGCGLLGWLQLGPLMHRDADPHTYLVESSREIAVFALAVFAGQMVPTAALARVWRSQPPSEFLAWFAVSLPLTNTPLLAIGAVAGGALLLTLWMVRGDPAQWRRVALATCGWILMIATTAVYLGAANARLSAGGLSDGDVATTLKGWQAWHWTRMVIGVLGVVLVYPVIGGKVRPGPPVIRRPEWVTSAGFASAVLLGLLAGASVLAALLPRTWAMLSFAAFLKQFAWFASGTTSVFILLIALSGAAVVPAFIGSLSRPFRDGFWFTLAAVGWATIAAAVVFVMWPLGRTLLAPRINDAAAARALQMWTWASDALCGVALAAAYAAVRALRPSVRPPAVLAPASLVSPQAPFETIDEAIGALNAWERRFCWQRDRRGVFAIAYTIMLPRLRRDLEKGVFEDASWVTAYALRLASRYDHALRADAEQREVRPECWAIALDRARQRSGWVLKDLDLALNAHIDHDHVMSLLDVGLAPSPTHRHQDYMRVNRALQASVEDAATRIGEIFAPGVRMISRLVGPLDRVVAGIYLRRRRERAWRRTLAILEAPDPAKQGVLIGEVEEDAARQARELAAALDRRPLLGKLQRWLEATNSVALPPGQLGLPWLGQSLQFAKDPAGFLEARFRRYGPAFKLRLLGNSTIALVGPEAFSFVTDERRFRRERANPRQWRELMDWECTPLIDGARRVRRKQLLLQAFTPAAIDDYLVIIAQVLDRYLQRWAQLGEFDWVEELKGYSLAVGEALYLGASPAIRSARDRATLDACYRGMQAVPINLPFTTFGRAVRARDRLIGAITRAKLEHEAAPAADLMDRLIAARDETGGLTTEEIQMETVQLFYASYGATYAVLSCVCLALASYPDFRRRATEEILRVGRGLPPTMTGLQQLDYVDRFTREVRRFYPLVATTLFAEAVEHTQFGGFNIPRGWKVICCIAATLRDERTFATPDVFDPDRFMPERFAALPENSWVPHGGGRREGHRCAGEALADAHLKLFTSRLLRDYVWDVPPQDTSLDPSEGIPIPRDRLHVTFARATRAPASSASKLDEPRGPFLSG